MQVVVKGVRGLSVNYLPKIGVGWLCLLKSPAGELAQNMLALIHDVFRDVD